MLHTYREQRKRGRHNCQHVLAHSVPSELVAIEKVEASRFESLPGE